MNAKLKRQSWGFKKENKFAKILRLRNGETGREREAEGSAA